MYNVTSINKFDIREENHNGMTKKKRDREISFKQKLLLRKCVSL